MKISETVDIIQKSIKMRRRLLLVGKPGIGKTEGFTEACERIKAEKEGAEMDLIVLCSAVEDPSTIRGYPIRENGGAAHCLFDGIYRAMNATVPTLLVFDDLGEATEATMKAILRFIQHGEIDGRKLPEHVTIMAATNDVTHGAGVYGMIEPLKTRFHSIISVETDVDSVVQYGLSRNWPTDLLAFLRNSPDSLHDWKPSKSMHIDGACPRGWEYAGQWINNNVDDQEVIAGCVGKGNAVKYLTFRKLINEVPDVDECLLSPKKAPVPEEPSARWLISMAIASRMEGGNFGACVEYLNRLPMMFRAGAIRDAIESENNKRKEGRLTKNYKPIGKSRDFIAWATEEGKEIRGAISA